MKQKWNNHHILEKQSLPSIGHSMHQKNVILSYALKKNQSANYISFVL